MHRSLAMGFALIGPLAGSTARWAPAVGEAVEWRWRVESKLELSDAELRSTDPNVPNLDEFVRDTRFEVRDRLELVALARIEARGEGAPIRSVRRLDTARRHTSCTFDLGGTGGARPDEFELASPLEGAELEFEIGKRSGELEAAFADESSRRLDARFLDGLDEELDLRGLLDEDERAPGDAWYLSDASVRRLLRPGGNLHLAAPEDDFAGEHENAALGWLLDASLLAGEAHVRGRAEYERVEESADGPVALVRLEIELDASGEVRDALAELEESLGSGSTWLDFAQEIRVEHELRLDGYLRWDLAADRARSLELRGPAKARLELCLRDWPLTVVVTLKGETSMSVEARSEG